MLSDFRIIMSCFVVVVTLVVWRSAVDRTLNAYASSAYRLKLHRFGKDFSRTADIVEHASTVRQAGYPSRKAHQHRITYTRVVFAIFSMCAFLQHCFGRSEEKRFRGAVWVFVCVFEFVYTYVRVCAGIFCMGYVRYHKWRCELQAHYIPSCGTPITCKLIYYKSLFRICPLFTYAKRADSKHTPTNT